MPRIDPFREKNTPPRNSRRERQESISHFLRNLFFSASQPSEPSIVEDLLEAISPVWDEKIVPMLISAFGNLAILYAIFYAPDTPENEVILEVWDPKYFDTKPSELFRFKGIPNVEDRLPTSRKEAQIFTLENWY